MSRPTPRPTPRPPARTLAVVAGNRAHYERLVEAGELYAARGDTEQVLRWAVLAANHAWLAPTGRVADPRLERLVVEAVGGGARPVVDGGREGRRVLHVLSEAYSVGGHTRLAWRWMNRDPRTSDLVLTDQRGPVPQELTDAVLGSGGRLHDLRSRATGLLDRARALRELMADADLVVLHVHPHDAIALAAVALPGVRPPVVHEDHCDHMFWLGTAGADLVCDLRPQAPGLLGTGARGLPAERIGLLPMPVDRLVPVAGDDLRARLGIAPGAVVAVTMSAQYKMAPTWGRGMTHLLDRALHWSTSLTALVVGTEPDPEWDKLARKYPGRVFGVGRVPDPAPYFAVADLYLDSYPLTSATSSLEAAALGLPVVSLTDVPETDPAHLFQALSPGLLGQPAVTSVEQFAVTVRRLAADPDLRRRTGEAARDSVLALHDGPGWLAAMEALYARARSLAAVDPDELATAPLDERYGALLHLAHNRADDSPDPSSLVGVLGDLYDDAMEADLMALSHRDEGPSLTVRVRRGWEDDPAWTTRLLGLAAAHPRLSVSLPFAADDDRRGTRSAGLLAGLLDGVGLTPETCGAVSVEHARPAHAVPSVSGELPVVVAALDWLELLISSPCWVAPREPAAVGV